MEARDENEALEGVRLEGGNMGASMSVSHGGECKLPNCCCINIYVNSNIQGVNNSTLNGGEVKMGSPGVFFLFGDMEPKLHQNKTSSLHQNPKLWQWGLMILLLLFLLLPLLFMLLLEIKMLHS
ncbi:hypothetical protein Csa_004893 [Cucumis sativus]|uniref:Uncharacterized protein n=1 Tax=Cucumis sativus TaxID=3659 RepID=A0A0A0KBZ5_CUCSA|nr:hypothetical protein Csa_004893 [Cucumis sativus]